MEIAMDAIQIQVVTGPDGGKIMRLFDKSGIVVSCLLDPRSARKVGLDLSSSVLVADGPILPKPSNGRAH